MITRLTKHDNCSVVVKNHHKKPHQYSLHCENCNTWIQWLSTRDALNIIENKDNSYEKQPNNQKKQQL